MLQSAKKIHGQLAEWRRDFHWHPELGYEELHTSGIVANHLLKLGLEVRTKQE